MNAYDEARAALDRPVIGYQSSRERSLESALRALLGEPVPADERDACKFCGWTGPRTQYLGVERIPIAHPDGPHEKDWLRAIRRWDG